MGPTYTSNYQGRNLSSKIVINAVRQIEETQRIHQNLKVLTELKNTSPYIILKQIRQKKVTTVKLLISKSILLDSVIKSPKLFLYKLKKK